MTDDECMGLQYLFVSDVVLCFYRVFSVLERMI